MRVTHFDESDFKGRISRDDERSESCEQGSNGKLPSGSVTAQKFRWDEPPPASIPKRARPIEAGISSNERESDHILNNPPALETSPSGSNVLLAGHEHVTSPPELLVPLPAGAPLALEAESVTPPATSPPHSDASGNGHTIDKAAVAREIAAALSLRNQGDYVRAIAAFTSALKLDPACAEAYAHRGAALRLMGDYARAIADCSAALALDYHLAIAFENRGAVYRTTGETAKAVADFSEVIRLDPKNTLALCQRGNALDELGEQALAIADYTAAVQLDPRSQWAWQSRGQAYAATGALVQAVGDFSEVLRLDARSVLALYQRGDARLKLGQHEQAIADFTAALVLDPRHALALARRAGARHAQGNLELALADYSAALEIEPQHIENLHSRGLVHRLRGDLDAALVDLNQVLQLDPDHQPAANNRGNLHFARGDYDKAIEDYSVAVRLDPQFARGYANRGNVYFTRGAWEQAVADYTEAVKSDPKFARAYMNRGLAQARLGRYKDVIADCTAAIKLDPELAPPYYYRGHAYARLGQFDAALLDFNQSLLRDPRDYLSYIDRGLLYANLKDYERAIDDYTSALQLEPRNALIYANRAIAHRNLDEHEQALNDTARAAVLDPKYALSYIAQQARAHSAAGDYRRAVADFTVALALDPDNTELKRGRDLAVAAAGPLEFDPRSEIAEPTDEEVPEEPGEAQAQAAPIDVDQFLLEEIPAEPNAEKAKAAGGKDFQEEDADFLAEFLLDTPPKKKPAAPALLKPPAKVPTTPAPEPKREATVVPLKKKKTPLGSQIWDAKELGALVREGIKNTPEGNRPSSPPSSTAGSGVNLAKKDTAKKPEDRASAIESLLFDEAPVSSMTRTTPAEPRLPGTSLRSKGQTQILKKAAALEEEAIKTPEAPQAIAPAPVAKAEPATSPSPPAEIAEAPDTLPFAPAKGTASTRPGNRLLKGVAAAVFLLAAGYLVSEFALGSGGDGFGRELPVAATLSTKEFCREYLNDNRSANVKFAGKILRVRGKVQEVVTDKNPRLVFVPAQEGAWTVECMFGHPKGLAGVAVDREVVILGECQLRTKADGNVQLYNCQIHSGS